jgi:hypothetical protein
MTLKELDGVKVAVDIPEMKLKKGAMGTIVHIHEKPNLAYMVEFSDKLGRTNALYSLLPEQLQSASITRQEREKYFEAGDLPYNPDDNFCVDPNS